MPRSTAGHVAAAPEVRGSSGIAAAAGHLLSPNKPPGVRSLARRVGLSPQAISVARRQLTDAGLINADGRPAIPDLFWAFADAWSPKRIELASIPDPADVTLVVTGTRAAVGMGAPLVVTADYPLDLLAPDEETYQRTRLLAGEATNGQVVATLALAPTPLAVDDELVGAATVAGWPSTHPLFVAAELANDPTRGAEALASWEPEGFARVW